MNVFGLVMGVVLAVAGIMGGVYALWGGGAKEDTTAWHDTSLDEWRKARDAEAAAERQARLAAPRVDVPGGERHDRRG